MTKLSYTHDFLVPKFNLIGLWMGLRGSRPVPGKGHLGYWGLRHTWGLDGYSS